MHDVRRYLIMMCGLPFAGKSTLAAEIARALDLPIVCMDAINTERGLGGGVALTPAQWGETYREMFRQLDVYMQAGISVIQDAPNASRRERDDVRAIAMRYKAITCVVYIPVGEAEARVRLHANRLTPARHDVRNEDFDHVVAAFEPPDDEPDIVRYDATVPPAIWVRETFAPHSH